MPAVQVDTSFAIFALVCVIGLAQDPITKANGYAMITGTASALQIIVTIFLPTW